MANDKRRVSTPGNQESIHSDLLLAARINGSRQPRAAKLPAKNQLLVWNVRSKSEQ